MTAIVLFVLVLLLLSLMWRTLRNRIDALQKEVNQLKRQQLPAVLPKFETPGSVTAEPEYPWPLPATPSAPSFSTRLRSYLSNKEWEAVVGGSILNKIGALVLVIGIALFLAYSYASMAPAGRASISAALSIAILMSGLTIERKSAYRVFAGGLIGAGWAGLYATAYAMYALPATRVIPDPFTGSLLLLLVAAGMIAHSLRYRVQALTAVAYFSAFAALAATPSTPFAVMSLIPLAASLLYLAWRFEWHSMALYGLAATYGTCISRGASNAPLFATESLFIIYWVIFEGFDLLRLRKRLTATPLTLVFPLNAVAFLGLSANAWSLHAPQQMWRMAAVSSALFMASACIRLWLAPPATLPAMSPRERLQYGTYESPLAISAVLAGLAIVGRVPGLWASVALAAEAEILYLAGVRFGLIFLRVLGSIGLSFSLASVLWNGSSAKTNVLGVSLHNWTPPTLFHAFLFYLNRLLWSPNLRFSFSASALAALVLAAECRAPYDCFAILFLSLGLAGFGLRKRLAEFRIQAYLGVLAAALLTHPENFQAHATFETWIAPAAVAAVCYVMSGSIIFIRPELLAGWELRYIRDGFAILASAMAMAALWMIFPGIRTPLAWTVLAVCSFEAGRALRMRSFYWIALGIGVCAYLNLLRIYISGSADAVSLAQRLAWIVPLIGAFYFLWHRSKGQAQSIQVYFSILGTLVLAVLLYQEVSGSLLTVAWGLEAVALLVGGFAAGERILRLQGLVLLLICILKLFLYDLRNLETMARILSFIALGVLLLAVSWAYTRFRENIKRYL